MGPLIVGVLLASGLSIVFWAVAGYLVRRVLQRQPVVHRALVYLVIASFILIDLFAFAIVGRRGPGLVAGLFSFATGLQTVAALAAIIFIRRVRRQ